jgi:hypothetical protein
LNNRHDVTSLLAAVDDQSCNFSDTSIKENSNFIVARFNKPASTTHAKLLLHVKSSGWLDKMYDNFTQAFGGYYNSWVKKQQKLPASELERKSLAQHFPLTVSIKTSKGWKDVHHLNNIGPLAYRDVLVPLTIEEVPGTQLEVKLSTGFMFWDVDYIGIDYSPNDAFTVQSLDPISATDEIGRDVKQALSANDHSYLDQPHPGNAAIVKFKYDESLNPDEATTVILHTGGYYEHVRNYKGLPQLAFLKKFKQPGAFAAFSRQQYMSTKKFNGNLAFNR